MYSNKSEYSHRRHYSNRDSRPWDEEGKREERLEPQRNVIRDPYGKNSVDGHSSREYSDLHKRQNSPDSKRDWRRKSPVRRRMSSPDRSLSVKRRRTSPEQDHYRHQREPEETYGQPPEDYSQVRAKDIKRTLSLEEDYSRKRTPEDTRYSHIHDELPYIQHQDEPSYRQTDRDGRERSRDQPQESTRSRDLTVGKIELLLNNADFFILFYCMDRHLSKAIISFHTLTTTRLSSPAATQPQEI